MNKRNRILYYGFAIILVIIAATMKILHVPNASLVFIFAFILGQSIQSSHIRHLEKQLSDLGEIKNKNRFYGLATVMVVGAAIMKILHVPYADFIFLVACVCGVAIQSIYIKQLENRLNNTKLI